MVDPVPDGSLDLENDGDQDFLDHLRVLNSLWISEDLFDSWVDSRPLRLDELELSSDPPLDLGQRRLVHYLVHFLLDLQLVKVHLLDFPAFLLNLESSVGPHLYQTAEKELQFQYIAD